MKKILILIIGAVSFATSLHADSDYYSDGGWTMPNSARRQYNLKQMKERKKARVQADMAKFE